METVNALFMAVFMRKKTQQNDSFDSGGCSRLKRRQLFEFSGHLKLNQTELCAAVG